MSFFVVFFVVSSALYAELAVSQRGPSAWTASPFSPFSLPLAVRSPYLNTWLAQGNDPPGLSSEWGSYWSNSSVVSVCLFWKFLSVSITVSQMFVYMILLQVMGWFVAIVVDDQAYELVGHAAGVSRLNGSVTQKSVSFSPTNTTFNMQTGPMDITLTFLSPIEVLV